MDPLIGSSIGPYQVVSLAGEGAMGRVYRALDTKLERLCALKFLQSALVTSEPARQRFLREARAAARLIHPNIATVFGVLEHDGQIVIASEWIEGRTLEGMHFPDRSSWPRALSIIAQLAAALDAAHRAGVVHRDIKPANVMLSDGGQIKLCDFGLARIEGGSMTFSELAGTPVRMAPEIWEGAECGRSADLFAFATVAYEMFTGRAPFEGKTIASLAYQIVHEPHVPPSKVNPGLAPAADDAIGWALAKKSEDRPATAILYFEKLCEAFNIVVPSGFWYGIAITPGPRLWKEPTAQPFASAEGRPRTIRLEALRADVLDVEADVLAVKFAQSLYGVDEAVATRLVSGEKMSGETMPRVGEHCLVEARGCIAAKAALFVGTRSLADFDYSDISMIPRAALGVLAHVLPLTRTVAFTLHGVGVGLDETEALKAEFQGIAQAIRDEEYPKSLERILIVEQNQRRAELIKYTLSCLLPEGCFHVTDETKPANSTKLTSPALSPAERHRVFVALPPTQQMEDVYHYGIERPVNTSGYVCERADAAFPNENSIAWAKRRIANSALFLADLSGNDPNVYLHVGFAWDQSRNTLLLVPEGSHPRFELGGLPHITYGEISELEKALYVELDNLQRHLSGIRQPSVPQPDAVSYR